MSNKVFFNPLGNHTENTYGGCPKENYKEIKHVTTSKSNTQRKAAREESNESLQKTTCKGNTKPFPISNYRRCKRINLPRQNTSIGLWIKKQDPAICCPRDPPLRHKDGHGLKVKDGNRSSSN